ncbi:MAG: hypothetical protein EAZ57_01635 [Cytophagales bacterium]|nr:MAG: hypothetical protein EAZ67_01640 [Cytophagales bacterium]TAF62150.1 MAG: hypothetical protein EAZ57_01635 [Cytophagales bacterium]
MGQKFVIVTKVVLLAFMCICLQNCACSQTDNKNKKKTKTMSEFNVDGRMSVRTLKEKFKNTFGLSLRVYIGNNAGRGARLADDGDRLGTLSDERGALSSENGLDIKAGMTIGEFEVAFQKTFDLAVQIADADNEKLMPNDHVL